MRVSRETPLVQSLPYATTVDGSLQSICSDPDTLYASFGTESSALELRAYPVEDMRTPNWTYTLEVPLETTFMSAITLINGTIYIWAGRSIDGLNVEAFLLGIDANTGTEVSRFSAPILVWLAFSAPQAYNDNLLLSGYGASGSSLYMINPVDQKIIWSQEEVFESGLNYWFVGDLIVVNTYGIDTRVFNALSGDLVWRKNVNDSEFGKIPPVFEPVSGNIITGDLGGSLFAFDPLDGSLIWQKENVWEQSEQLVTLMVFNQTFILSSSTSIRRFSTVDGTELPELSLPSDRSIITFLSGTGQFLSFCANDSFYTYLMVYDLLNDLWWNYEIGIIGSVPLNPYLEMSGGDNGLIFTGISRENTSLLFEVALEQLFWIMSSVNGNAMAPNPDDHNFIFANTPALAANQLWSFDPFAQSVVNKADGNYLDISSGSGSGLVTRQRVPGRPEQAWNLDPTSGALLSRFEGQAATLVEADNEVLAIGLVEGNDTQVWFLQPFVAHPDESFDQLDNLQIGAPFTLSVDSSPGLVLVVNDQESPNVQLVSEEEAGTSAIWIYQNDQIINSDTGLALTAVEKEIIAMMPGFTSNQSWSLTGDGFLVNTLTDFVVIQEETTISLAPYNALRPPNQFWNLQVLPSLDAIGSPSETTEDSYEQNEVESPPQPVANIDALSVTAKVSTDLFSGTTDTISLSMGFNNFEQLLFEAPAAGDEVTIEIDIEEMFGVPMINIGEITHISIFQHPTPHPIASDAWKLESIILKATNTATGQTVTNFSFQRVNKWIDNPHDSTSPSWVGAISWGGWLDDATERPIDLGLSTFEIKNIPYIIDIYKWRTYDAATIDGVGQIVGMRNGRIIGELLKTRQSQELVLTSDQFSYTWVFTPEGAIIYKLWDKEADRNLYIRHSQLGSGAAVICAGELQIKMNSNTFGENIDWVIGMVNTESGHYQPDGGACLEHLSNKLEEIGIPTDQIQWYFRPKITGKGEG